MQVCKHKTLKDIDERALKRGTSKLPTLLTYPCH